MTSRNYRFASRSSDSIPGRIDGIFGVLTEEALNDFQRNCALDVERRR